MKKTISLFAILTAAVLLNSCWIAPVYQDYETVGKVCYFKDYETMRAVTVAKINKSFTDWHWSTKEFDEKIDQYKNNINPNNEDSTYLTENGYEWAVRNESSKVTLKNGKSVGSEYYWITNEKDESVIFFKSYSD